MGLEGMDVDRIREIAQQLDGQAERLQGFVTVIDGLIQETIGTWNGNDAETFISWWHNQHRPAILRVHETLRGMADSARNNASEQERTSAATGSGSFQGAYAAWHTFNGATDHRVYQGLDDVSGIFGRADRLTHWLGPLPGLKQLGAVGALPLVSYAGKAFTAFDLTKDAGNAVSNFHSGHIGDGTLNVSDGISTGLKASKNPVLYLAGVNVSLWSDVGKAATQVDWHQGVPNPLSGDNLQTIWFPAIESSLLQTGGDVFKAVL